MMANLKMVPEYQSLGAPPVPKENPHPAPKKREHKERMSVEDARRQVGANVASLRKFSDKLNDFIKNTTQVLSAGDFGPATVEAAGELLAMYKDTKVSLEQVYDVSLERNYARLPPRRGK